MNYFIIILSLVSLACQSQDLSKYFTDLNVSGGISIYDFNQQSWFHSDELYAKKGSLPASTFKIIHTLIGLEEEVINGKNHIFKWDGKAKLFKTLEIPNWNKDNDLEMAFKNSTIWYYEQISNQLKKRKYCRYLKKSNYSNRKIRQAKGNDFWNYGDLKVTPIDQVELLIKLYKNKLPFEERHQILVKELMIEEENKEYIIRSKTGWSYDGLDIGWYVGYIDFNDNLIFFATRIEKELTDDMPAFSKKRKSITKQIFYDLYGIN